MLSGLKELPLVSKIMFIISLIVLFVWVIPSMVYYFKSVQVEERQKKELQASFLKAGIDAKNTKRFTQESFIQDSLNYVLEVSVEPLGDKSYTLRMDVDKDKISDFNTFLEGVSLRYLVKITTPITIKEKDKHLEVTMIIEEI